MNVLTLLFFFVFHNIIAITVIITSNKQNKQTQQHCSSKSKNQTLQKMGGTKRMSKEEKQKVIME
jgi:hypothetical protein